MKDIVSTEDISGLSKLFVIYQSIYGDRSTMDDFYAFLSVDAPERTAFLEEHCDYTYQRVGKTYVLKVKPKEE